MTTRKVEGHDIVTDGSIVCPSPLLCDRDRTAKGTLEPYGAYVLRHARDHRLGDFDRTEDAERNLGLYCFYYDHKYVYGNPTLTPYPFWEIHAFIAEDEWNEDDLEERLPIQKRTFARLPDAADRRPGEARSMKQVELPRQCEKTSIGARAWPIHLSKREYFVTDVRNYPIMIRSATALNSRDSLRKIYRRATLSAAGRTITRLYGLDAVRCMKCGTSSQIPRSAERKCPLCGEAKKVRFRAISLIDPAHGAGGTGLDSITFRWATETVAATGIVDVDDPRYDPFSGTVEDEDGEAGGDGGDEDAVYSVRAVGLKTELTGQRPREYLLDDIQTTDNSNTHEKRMLIINRFDESVRQLEFGGRLKVFDTRKYTNDFAAAINIEPLRSEFHTLHRRVYWQTDEPDAAPFVVGGFRYYYPEKGNGRPALDAAKVDKLERQMIDRDFAAEYLNDPTDSKRATFKRENFPIIDVEDELQYNRIPPEVRYGLGRAVTTEEQFELDSAQAKIRAMNFWDIAGKDGKSKRGDDDFGVGLRVDRYGGLWIVALSAGQYDATKTWDEVERVQEWNRPTMFPWNDYEMGVDEKNCRPSFEKWLRDKSDSRGVMPVVQLHFSHMPKSGKDERIGAMHSFLPIRILSNAGLGNAALVDKYIGQWLAWGRNADHDDGPDATARWISYARNYRTAAQEQQTETEAYVETLTGGVPWKTMKALAGQGARAKSWGEIAP